MQVATAAVALFGGLQLLVAVLARHGMTEVESIIATHAMMLSRGESLYWNLDQYPFTISPYGPILYSLEALGVLAGAEPMAVGRVVSFLALLATVWLVYRIVLVHTADRRYAWTGALLAAGTSNLVSWGVIGQSDMTALAFSTAAVERYSVWRRDRRGADLVWCGLWIALSIFSKQSFLAAGAAISLMVLLDDRKTGLRFVGGLAPAGVAAALGVNWITGGYYFDNAILANLNPFSWEVLGIQLQYLVNACGALIFVAAAGWRGAFSKEGRPLYAWLLAALAVFLLTAPKVGSDLNYQIELVAALSVCAGWALWRLDFFDKVIAQDKGLVPLLQIPLLLHIVLNCAVDVRHAGVRYMRDQERRTQFAQLERWVKPEAGRVVSVEIDPLLLAREGRIEVEPLIFSFLVEAGVADPEPVLSDLKQSAFDALLLYHDVNKTPSSEIDTGAPRLPPEHMQVVRENYRLVEHVPGPLMGGIYVYQPKHADRESDPGLTARSQSKP